MSTVTVSSSALANGGQASQAKRWALRILFVGVLLYLPMVLTTRSIFGIPLSNMQLLNLGLTQMNVMMIMMIGALSLNYLTGVAGLISIGHAALYAVGAMTAAIFGTQFGLPFPVALVAATIIGALAGVIAGLPSLRVRGLYFVLSTMALHYIVVFLFQEYQFKVFDVVGVPYKPALLGSFELSTQIRWYFFLLPIVALIYFGLRNSLQSREGRTLIAMRDHELAATSVGADVRILRLKTFALTSAIASFGGALYAYYLSNVNSETFGIQFAIQFIAMIIVGGMGSLRGSMVGAGLWLLLPSIISGFASQLGSSTGLVRYVIVDHKAQLVQIIFSLIVIVLLIYAPGGISGLYHQLRDRLATGPRS
jgi:branched-chain amino acid transport system permease protein